MTPNAFYCPLYGREALNLQGTSAKRTPNRGHILCRNEINYRGGMEPSGEVKRIQRIVEFPPDVEHPVRHRRTGIEGTDVLLPER